MAIHIENAIILSTCLIMNYIIANAFESQSILVTNKSYVYM